MSFQIMFRPLVTAVTVLSAVSMPYASPLPGGKQYGAVLDAGSSSTKVRVYSLEKVPGKIPKVEEVFYSKVKPGISGFEDNVGEITTYISQIITAISEAVPAPQLSGTPVYFMATAGEFEKKPKPLMRQESKSIRQNYVCKNSKSSSYKTGILLLINCQLFILKRNTRQ